MASVQERVRLLPGWSLYINEKEGPTNVWVLSGHHLCWGSACEHLAVAS